jgi:hypothetical protein
MKGLFLLVALGAAVILQVGANSRKAQLSILKMAGGTPVSSLPFISKNLRYSIDDIIEFFFGIFHAVMI